MITNTMYVSLSLFGGKITTPIVEIKRPSILSISTIPKLVFRFTEKALCDVHFFGNILFDSRVASLNAEKELRCKDAEKEVQSFFHDTF